MTDKDPIVMYLIVRESLGMSPGKIGAQTGHAVGLLTEKYYKKLIPTLTPEFTEEEAKNSLPLIIFYDWQKSSHTKVVLGADDKEWEKIKALSLDTVIVRDAGHTEVEPGSETVIGVWPMRKSQVPSAIKRLRLL